VPGLSPRRQALLLAPTGPGQTLAGFLAVTDDLQDQAQAWVDADG
jgi:Lhr-like helicase